MSVSELVEVPEGASASGPPLSAEARAAQLLAALRLTPQAYHHLLPEQLQQLTALVLQYSEIFALDDSVLGCVPAESGILHRIPTGDARPVTQRGYRLSHFESVF